MKVDFSLEAQGRRRVYLCATAGGVQPRIVAGPWPDCEDAPPDEAVIAALLDDMVDVDDILFRLYVDERGRPSLETYQGGYMDEMRAQAEALQDG